MVQMQLSNSRTKSPKTSCTFSLHSVLQVFIAFSVTILLYGHLRILQTTSITNQLEAPIASLSFKDIDIKSPSPKHKQQLNIGLKCLSLENEMETLLSSTNQVYILMPAKAAGTSMAIFIRNYCMKKYDFNMKDNPYAPNTTNYVHPKQTLEYIKSRNDNILPPVLSSHTMKKDNLIGRIQDESDDTLILYLHRPETERLLSAIQHVVYQICTMKNRAYGPVMNRINYNAHLGTCMIEESALFTLVQDKVHEIEKGLKVGIDCSFYDEIQKKKEMEKKSNGIKTSTPKMVIVDYKQANVLQKVIAKHYCPEVLDKLPIHKNVGSKKGVKIYVTLEQNDKSKKTVDIADWLKKKEQVIRLLTDWFDDYECQGKMRNIEDKMFSSSSVCRDRFVQLISIENGDNLTLCSDTQ